MSIEKRIWGVKKEIPRDFCNKHIAHNSADVKVNWRTAPRQIWNNIKRQTSTRETLSEKRTNLVLVCMDQCVNATSVRMSRELCTTGPKSQQASGSQGKLRVASRPLPDPPPQATLTSSCASASAPAARSCSTSSKRPFRTAKKSSIFLSCGEAAFRWATPFPRTSACIRSRTREPLCHPLQRGVSAQKSTHSYLDFARLCFRLC